MEIHTKYKNSILVYNLNMNEGLPKNKNNKLELDNSEISKSNDFNPVETLYKKELESESYEDVSSALDGVLELQNFRKKLSSSPFGKFHSIVEFVSLVKKTGEKYAPERIKEFLDHMQVRSSSMSPRVADIYLAIISELRGEEYNPKFEITKEKINDLLASEGRMSDFDVLFSPDVSFDIKLNYIDKTLEKVLSGARSLDKREGKEMEDDIRTWREEQIKNIPRTPPKSSDRSKPGVDPMERLKGKESAPSWWKIVPPWSAHYREKSLSRWDENAKEWHEDKDYNLPVSYVSLSGIESKGGKPGDVKMSGAVESSVWYDLPIPYTHGLHKIDCRGGEISVVQSKDGDIKFMVNSASSQTNVDIFLAPNSNKIFIERNEKEVRVPDIKSIVSESTQNVLDDISKKYKDNVKKAEAVKLFILKTVKYLSPKNLEEAEHYNNFYRSHKYGFVGAVDEVKTGDCDVVNTYFAGLCAKLNIPVRHVVGHSVRGAKEGVGSINSGTGHAWSEVFDEVKKQWIRIDATPGGDPNLEESDEKSDSENSPGEIVNNEAFEISDDKLQELRQKLEEKKEQLSYTKEERSLAEGASIELKEARQIVKEINEAENTRLPNGELVVDVLAKLFNNIIESRKSSTPGYTGPVRSAHGGEDIENIVSHYIQSFSGDTDPMSRRLPTTEEKIEKLIGGFDVYIIGDKSGSMHNTSSGEVLWKMQRRAMYLILSALHSFEKNLEKSGLRDENKMSVRTQSLSFRGEGLENIDLDKELGPKFTAKDKVSLWHSLTEVGGGNGDVTALNYVSSQIHTELEELKNKNIKDDRLRIVIACSDGGYVGSESQMRSLAEELGKTGTVVVGMGMTASANSVPAVMQNPPFSFGDIVEDINNLPVKVAKHIVMQALKLFPEKAREDARESLERMIIKFNK